MLRCKVTPAQFSTLLLFLILPFSGHSQPEKATNLVFINPTDSEADILRKAANVTPTPRQLRWQKLELTSFFHFGINTFTNKEWGDGTESPALFNPTNLDANQWVRVCKKAGIKQVILTAKHHDGFCLWPSEFTEHSVKHSPWKDGKGDVVKEVADACKAQGMGFGIYLSPWDRHDPTYGTDAYNTYFVNQLTELLTHYGKVDEVWFDGANGEGPNGKKQVYDFEAWYKLIRKLQPQAVIAIMGPDVRWVGTETGYGRETEWSVLPANNLAQDKIAAESQKNLTVKPQYIKGDDLGNRPQLNSAKALVWYPAETDVSIRPGWFYHPEEDNQVKSAEKLLDIYYNSVGKNGVLLLNIPPDARGQLSESDQKNLLAWKALMDQTFQKNLAKEAVITSKNGLRTPSLFDGNTDTYWSTKGQDSTATLELSWPKPTTFDLLQVQENIQVGQRIESFTLDYWNGTEWVKAAQGTTVGFKRILRFAPVTTNRVRLSITASRLNPTLAEFGLYKQVHDEQ